MKLYDKKFLIYENCMIRSFGQPGYALIARIISRVNCPKLVKMAKMAIFKPS